MAAPFAQAKAAEPAPFDPDNFEPYTLGPTWQRKPNGKWLLPKRTLGWEIIGWCGQYLHSMTPGRKKVPWTFTPEQTRWLLWWYAVDDEGNFVYRTGVLQRLKGWGKDPLAAVLCLVEAFGPCRFSHWDDAGNPVAMPAFNPWVQIVAVSQTQTRNTMKVFPVIMSKKLIQDYGIKAGTELIRGLNGEAHIEAVTSNFRAVEGGRTTFTVLNETHHWVDSNQGHLMAETIDGNSTKMAARYLAITNAYLPGEDSVAERQREAYEDILEGRAPDVGIMYDSLEAPAGAPLGPPEVAIKVIEKIRGDAVWLKPLEIVKSIMNRSISAARSRRMWYNQVVADEDALFSREQWDALSRERELAPGDEIVLGFDGGKSDDATALVAIRVSDRTAFLLALWQAPDGPEGEGWVVPRERVHGAVQEAHSLYTVRAFYADVALWESYIALWEGEYADSYGVKSTKAGQAGGGIGWNMKSDKQATLANVRLMQTIFDGKLYHDGNVTLRRHALNARRRPNAWGISFGKESRESRRKVDAYAALVLAHEALIDLTTRGKRSDDAAGMAFWL